MHRDPQQAGRHDGAALEGSSGAGHHTRYRGRLISPRRFLTLCGALAVSVAAAVVPLAVSSSAATVPLLGSYDGAANTSGAASFASATDTTPSVYSDYAAGQNESWTDWNNTIAWLIPQLKGQLGNSRLELSVPLASGGYSSNAAALAAFASNPATFDSNMETLAQTLISNGFSNAIIRLMWEPQELGLYSNDDLTSAANYAALFRDAHSAMASVSGSNFQWAWYWEANFDSNTNSTAYPGSTYVDYITNDFYDQSWVTTCGVPYNGTAFTATQENCLWNASNGYAATLKSLTDFASQMGKPIGIGEWGVISRSDNHGGNDDPTFIADYANWLKSSNVAWASYFNFNDGGLNSTLSNFPNSEAAYKADLGGSSAAAPPATSTPTTAPSSTSAPAPTTTTTAPPPTTTTTAPAPTTTTTAPPPSTTTTVPATTTTTTPPSPTTPPQTTTTTTSPAPQPTPTTTTTTSPAPPPTTTTTSPAPPPGRPSPDARVQTTVTWLHESESSATVGHESSLRFSVRVTPAVDETVGVYGDGGLLKLCDMKINAATGRGSCTLGDDELGPGLYSAGAITLSTPDFVGSFSNPVFFAISMSS